jgi:hypothetical protein
MPDEKKPRKERFVIRSKMMRDFDHTEKFAKKKEENEEFW